MDKKTKKKAIENFLKNLPDGMYLTGTGQLIKCHTKDKCEGEFCPIHNPSDHHMKDWPTHFRGDRYIMERICKCGVGHPDPDDLNFRIKKLGQDPEYAGVHGCCGCCVDPYPKDEEKGLLMKALERSNYEEYKSPNRQHTNNQWR